MDTKTFKLLWMSAITAVNFDSYCRGVRAALPPDEKISRKGLRNIYDAAKMPFREIYKSTGMSQAAFADKYCISKRTIENWSASVNRCPDYIRLYFARDLGILKF